MLEYQRIGDSGVLPNISHLKPFKVVIVIESVVSEERQRGISAWLVKSGCSYMMAWGLGCKSWDDSVDMANLERFNFGDIPDKEFVMTTWHETEPLKEVFWFSQSCASPLDQNIELKNTLILHLGDIDKAEEFQKLHREVESMVDL